MLIKHILLISLFISFLFSQEYKLRKYNNVKNFYSSILEDTIKLSIKYNTPPATILAISGLESGYGSGYIAQITGNILSLGANKNDIQLPPLTLPYCKNDKLKRTLFDPKEQQNCQELIWKKRPKSLKKDYRPSKIAGTKQNLHYFKYHKELYKKAQLKNIEDFLVKWLRTNHKYKPFSQTKIWLEKEVKLHGKTILFDYKTNIEFINKIGGKPNSFNYRKSWTQKVKYILDNVGLVNLCNQIHNKKVDFKQSWN